MRRIILYVLLLLLLSGCGTKKEIKLDDEKLSNILIEYGQSIYESDSFQYTESSENVYTMNLKTLKDNNKDITMFEKRECDLEKTRVEFQIVEEEGQTRFLYSPVLECK